MSGSDLGELNLRQLVLEVVLRQSLRMELWNRVIPQPNVCKTPLLVLSGVLKDSVRFPSHSAVDEFSKILIGSELRWNLPEGDASAHAIAPTR